MKGQTLWYSRYSIIPLRVELRLLPFKPFSLPLDRNQREADSKVKADVRRQVPKLLMYQHMEAGRRGICVKGTQD
jgi:hypothetical protein